MGVFDTMRMRLGLVPKEPDRTPKRYAPYPTWRMARVVVLVASAVLIFSILMTIVTNHAGWLLLLLLCFLVMPPFPAFWSGGGMFSFSRPLIPEWIAGALGSRYCPSCGQSIFDVSPPSGYFADTNRFRWWPNRDCANCGHDLRKRTADD